MRAARGAYVPKPTERQRVGRHPARCSKRSCQARRNLTKHPGLYARWPTCSVCGAKMYVDWYRMKKGPHDNAPVCKDPCCPWRPTNPERWKEPRHRVSTRGCSGWEDWKLERSLVRSKHSPFKTSEDDPPF